MDTKKGYCSPNKATLTAAHSVVRGQHHISAAQRMNSADPIKECMGRFQQLVLTHSMNTNLSASSLCNSLMTHPGSAPDVTLGPSLHASFWGHFLLCYHCGERRALSSKRPCLTAQVCPPLCQTFICSFWWGMLVPLHSHYQLQLR